MTIDHKLLIKKAFALRDKLPIDRSYGINVISKMPLFYDWIECRSDDKSSFKMYLAGGDDGVALRFFWNGSYEKVTLSLWGHFVKRKGTIIDVGAHTGAYTLAAYSKDNDANIISFEPHFMNFARLNMNLRGNGYSTSGIYMLGVGEKTETQPFSVSTNLSYLSAGGSIGKRNNSIIKNINIVSLDDFFSGKCISEIKLIKIDVEGHEAPSLRGMLNLIHENRPVIFLECISIDSGVAVTKILKNLNYLFFLIDDITGEIIPVDTIYPQVDADKKLIMNRLNRIALPSEELLKYMESFSY